MNIEQSKERIKDSIILHIAERLGVDPTTVDKEKSFSDYGLSSAEAISMMSRLEEIVDRKLSPTLVWDYSTVSKLVNKLIETESDIDMKTASKSNNDHIQSSEPIAVVGLSCRFPGANNPQDFWNTLLEGQCQVEEVPHDRWDADRFYDSDSNTKGKITSRLGGFIRDIDQFDASFMEISPREAPFVDPRQRLIMELGWEALEDAGIPPLDLSGSRTGVFIANLNNDFDVINSHDYAQVDSFTGAGMANSIIANRLSYFLNLRGPSLSFDTACSGSLTATHIAIQSLRMRESSIALVGGVNLNLLPKGDIFFSRVGALSLDGKCHSFDHSANGIVRSDGAGILVLMRLSEALSQGRRIYSQILGSAINHDGRSNGIMAPNREAQESVIKEAYQQSGVNPNTVQYIETHGTGTQMGDPIEIEALVNAIGIKRPKNSTCVIGALKSNFGHMEAAAGVAGIIKCSLAMYHRVIPPNIHFEELNPQIKLPDFPLDFPTSNRSWPDEEKKLLAGVSAFSFGGANAHVVIQESPIRKDDVGEYNERSYILPISANTPHALKELRKSYTYFLKQNHPLMSLEDVCFTASCGRSHLPKREAFVAANQEEMISVLQQEESSDKNEDLHTDSGQRNPMPIFVFSGQGSQWSGMGAELLKSNKLFQEVVYACDRFLADHGNWSFETVIDNQTQQRRINETEIAQVAIYSMQVALSRIWQSWGIKPLAIVGQSLGEVAAAHIAGALSFEEGLKIAFYRGRLMTRLAGRGKTGLVGISSEKVLSYLKEVDMVSLAGSSSPNASLVAGPVCELEKLFNLLENKNVFCRFLKGVDLAFHSLQMDEIKDELVASLVDLNPSQSTIPLYSTVSGNIIEGSELTADYWGRNLREPFCLEKVVRDFIERGECLYLELSPDAVIRGALLQNLIHEKKDGAVFHSLKRGNSEKSELYKNLAGLYKYGVSVNWNKVFDIGNIISLPTYPWQRKRYWLDKLPNANQLGVADAFLDIEPSPYPLLGKRVDTFWPAMIHVWERRVSANTFPLLIDHKALGSIMMPAAVYLEMVVAGLRNVYGSGTIELKDVIFEQALKLTEHQNCRLQLCLNLISQSCWSFHISSIPNDDNRSRESHWNIHARGCVEFSKDSKQTSDLLVLDKIRERCSLPVKSSVHYEAMRKRGLDYGVRFQVIRELFQGLGESLTRIEIPSSIDFSFDLHPLHVVLIDGAIQSMAVAVDSLIVEHRERAADAVYLPFRFERMRILKPLEKELWCHVILDNNVLPNSETILGEIRLILPSGETAVEIEGFALRRVGGAFEEKVKPADWLFELFWKSKELRQQTQLELDGTWVLFTHGEAIGLQFAEQLAAHGGAPILVIPKGVEPIQTKSWPTLTVESSSRADFENLFGRIHEIADKPLSGVIHLWGLALSEASSNNGTSSFDKNLEATYELGTRSVHNLCLQLSQISSKKAPLLWLITRHAAKVHEADTVSGIFQTPLWGLSKIIRLEFPNNWGGQFDLDTGGRDEIKAVVAEIVDPHRKEEIVAYRDSKRYLQQLERYPDINDFNHQPEYRKDACYLITGGLGGLGLTFARYLIDRGAQRLILITRSPLPERKMWSSLDQNHSSYDRVKGIQDLECSGASVHVGVFDVSDSCQVKAFLDNYRLEGWPPIRGVIHAAGVIEDRLMINLDDIVFRSVMDVKVQGAWALHEHTCEDPLDFFVLFSSASSIIGQLGQAPYAAGNAFMDALAHYRRARDLPATSVNWGPWSDVGMFAQGVKSKNEVFESPVETITPSFGIEIFDEILKRNTTQAMVLKANWNALPQNPLTVHLRNEATNILATSDKVESHFSDDQLLELLLADPAERVEFISSFLVELIGKTLNMETVEVDISKPLVSLGVDSIMAVSLKNQVDSSLSSNIDIADLFAKSIQQIAGNLAENMPAPENIEELLEGIENLSMEDVNERLREE